MKHTTRRVFSLVLAIVLVLSTILGALPTVAAAEENTIQNDSLKITVGDLGQISALNIVNNPVNNHGKEINFVLPNTERQQNGVQHQWMGELIFSVRSSEDGTFPEDNTGFVEVDTNKTLAEGGSTTASDINPDNPYITKTVEDNKVTVNITGVSEDSTAARAIKGFDVESVYDMNTDDGSLLWSITIENTSENYIEFGDVGLPMPWNNKYTSQDSVYTERVTAHTFAGADSGYAYAIRCSGEGNYILFTPVVETGARIEYVDNWIGYNNGVVDNRYSAEGTFDNWTADSGGWQPGLSVYYVHSKDIRKTGRSYFEDATSLILAPGESKTYSFKFSAVRAGDNSPQESAESANNASDSVEERETNLRSILYKNGMIDAQAVPSFQTALNMDTKLDLHYDEEKIQIKSVDIQCVHENDPYGEENIPEQQSGKVDNSRTGRGLHDGNEGYEESVGEPTTVTVDGETHHIYDLHFGCIGNNSVRVEYQLKVDGEWVDKFTQYEFNVLTELDEATDTHADFMVTNTQDTDPESATYGIFSDWYFASGRDSREQSHWGDDWSHDNINFIAMKNYLQPDAEQVKAIETYLIDFMWESYMKNTQDSYTVANYLSASGVYSETTSPYTRTFSEMMEATGFFNMYRIVKAYPDLIEYRKPATWYLEKAYGIYINRVGAGSVGFYGEQQIPDMIDALYAEGMTAEADELKETFAYDKAYYSTVWSDYPYGSEFAYDNTGEEGAFAAAQALLKYYPDADFTDDAEAALYQANQKTRAMRGIQPTWYQYADPVFIGGESWWNFQYTASLAGSIMDDYMRYHETEDGDSTAWAARVNYAAKLSNFNAINMGQISDNYVGNVSWRYNMYKGGYGAMNVNDGGTRVMNNGWQDFSGEADEGIYGSLLRISADVVNDPIFGLYGYGATVTKDDGVYTIVPTDGYGKRVNVLDEKIYVETVQSTIEKAVIAADGSSIELTLQNYTDKAHLSELNLSGKGIADGYYTITAGGEKLGQIYIKNSEGHTGVTLTGATTVLTLTADETAENAAPAVTVSASSDELKAIVPFEVTATATDDGAVNGTLTYTWTAATAPEGATVTFETPAMPTTTVVADTAGEYVIQVAVNDGEKETIATLNLTLGEAPERENPVITELTYEQDALNASVANLHADAELDVLYHGTAAYSWRLVSAPEGATGIIAAADQQDAKLLASAPGEYVVEVTVTDADKASKQELTITMDERADGVQAVEDVITKVGTAPVLPETAEVILTDGTVAASAITWEAVEETAYAEAGSFEVRGVVTDTTIAVKVTVRVVKSDRMNVAPYAVPTAIINTPQDLGGVAGLNDGFDPTSSRDTSHGVWHNWLGDQGATAWVQYTWDEPVLINGSDAYYYTDGNFQPKDCVLYYMTESGEWKEVPNAVGYGTDLNKYNTTTFSPIETTALKMVMNPKTLGIGVIEWKVYGYGTFLDKSALRNAISAAEAIKTPYFTEDSVEALTTALEAAKATLENSEATQEELDAAAEALNTAIANLVALDGDLALTASVESDGTASWENLNGINNPAFNPTESNSGSGKGWGNWYSAPGSEHYVGYIWVKPVTVNNASIYWYDDGGGTRIPAALRLEYVDENGEWQTAEIKTPLSDCTATDTYNSIEFEEITTTQLRLYQTVRDDANANGIYRFRLFNVDYVAQPVEELIDAIGEVTLASEEAIKAAREAYEALPEESKGNVKNYDVLVAAEEKLEELKNGVKAVEDLIDAIGEVTAESKEAIDAARAAYDALTDEQKAAVSNYSTLLIAEREYGVAAAQKSAEEAKAAAEEAQKAAEDAQKKAEDAQKKAEELAAAAGEDKTAAEKAAAEAEEAQKAAEDAQKAAEDAQKAAELAEKAAAEGNKDAAAAAATAAEYAKKMAEAYEEIAEIKTEVIKLLADAQVAAEKAEAERLAAEEAQKAAEEAALSAARYSAMYELADLLQDAESFTGHAKADYEQVITDAKAALETAKSAAEVEEILAAAKEALKTVGCVSAAFTDVLDGAWYHDGIDYMVAHGYMNGVSKSEFEVDGTLTRAQLVTILYRIAGTPDVSGTNPFEDVAAGQWYTDAIIWAAEAGVVNGTSKTTFEPDTAITREQIAVILYRYTKAEPVAEDLLKEFSDAATVSTYAVEAMNWALSEGLINGVEENGETTLQPVATATRAQIAVILNRYLEK